MTLVPGIVVVAGAVSVVAEAASAGAGAAAALLLVAALVCNGIVRMMNTVQTVYRVSICLGGNLFYIRTYQQQ